LNRNFRAKIERKNAKDFASEKERYLRKKNEKIVTAYKLAHVMLGMNRKSANKSKSSKTSKQVVPKSPVAITVEDNTTLNSNSQKNGEDLKTKSPVFPASPVA
jgi:hypothetical protein